MKIFKTALYIRVLCSFFNHNKVYDGPSTSDRLLLKASGSAIPPPVQSTTGQMLVTFTTDYSESFSGFSAAYSNGGPPGPPTGITIQKLCEIILCQ